MIDLSLTEDSAAVSEFLNANQYPYPWSVENLDRCAILRLTDGPRTVGFIWSHWVIPGRTIEFHVAVIEEYQGRWLNRRVIARLMRFGRNIGAKSAIAYIDRPLIASIYHRLGFDIAGPFAIINF
jgi:GNAT superfamily N-acetyltransferase